jgi:hypothetical protein
LSWLDRTIEYQSGEMVVLVPGATHSRDPAGSGLQLCHARAILLGRNERVTVALMEWLITAVLE